MNDGHELVIGGYEAFCWIPPGYIGSARASHCWAGPSNTSLFMAEQGGTLGS